jgi:hypothetical protein
MKPDTIMGWHRRLAARKLVGDKSRCYPGRPRINSEIEQLIVRMARENSGWGYDRIAGAMANLGYCIFRQGYSPLPVRGIRSTGPYFWQTGTGREHTGDRLGEAL